MKNSKIQYIQRAIENIESHLTEKLSVTEVAEKSGLSRWEFQRVFSSMLGESIGFYQRNRRLTLAAKRLRETDQKIIDIAFEFQFNSQEAFSRSFKNYFGHTPHQVRKKLIILNLKEKPLITQELLNHLNGGIKLTPEIIVRPACTAIGIERPMRDIYSNYQDFAKTLVPVWQKFWETSHQIENALPHSNIGLAKYDYTYQSEDQIYFAGVQVSEVGAYPYEDHHILELPEQKYAVFTNKGLGDKSSYALNYIYGTWLPQSEYERAYGDDFQTFDPDYHIEKQDSHSYFHIPIA